LTNKVLKKSWSRTEEIKKNSGKKAWKIIIKLN
jgi:hypothetical protein